jgi:cytochrome c oxidase subunit II
LGQRATAIVCASLLAVMAASREQGAAAPETRRFLVTASRYAYDPPRLEVARGDVVELELRSADTDHGLAIRAYGVKVAIPKGGGSSGVSFVASRAGRFVIECSEYCGSGHKRMRGELVVLEAAR